jgi:hypothetical protein
MFAAKGPLLAALTFLAVAVPMDASVILTSSSGGVYTYEFAIAPGNQLFFGIGDRITFTGLVGVTNASVSGPDLAGGLTTCGITATSVCFGAPSPLDLDNISSSTVDFGTLIIDAPGTTVGSVLYTLSVDGTMTGGETGGPHSLSTLPSPEPGGLPLIAGGAAVLLLVAPFRRKK